MPLFSVIRRGREQAKEQKAKDSTKTKEDVPKAPYKHVPTHAAIDAMSAMDNAEDSSGSDDELEMKKATRQGISHQSDLVETTRTRFAEPKPMDLGVLRDDLRRESSSTTLASTRNGNSYASSSASEIAPISTTPSSVASTPEPSVAVIYFPPETPKAQDTPPTEPTTGFIAVVSPPEASVDTLVSVPVEEPVKVAEVSPAVVTTVSTAFPGVDGLEKTCTLAEAKTPTASAKPPKKRRFSWRRNKLPTGDKLVASR
ncbi:hypothetical protein DL764_004304 [Monosporascus ibericus]|uniref:Uncharacterized protein n=1 Tax=Monosporascus ibericus TaxID=155417 RepID=A0A4Q4TDQ7_9PEZI|nr:hypothetical protein DL764_004304 [Monosporascus ibericus]